MRTVYAIALFALLIPLLMTAMTFDIQNYLPQTDPQEIRIDTTTPVTVTTSTGKVLHCELATLWNEHHLVDCQER